MENDWILDVLADLKTFAQKNGFVALAEQLDDATLIAATEIATSDSGLPRMVRDGETAGGYARTYRAGGDA